MPSKTTIPDPVLSDSDSNDSDFAASVSASDTEGSTSSDDDSRPRAKRKRAGDDETLASGDEGIVESGKRKKRRKHKGKSKKGKLIGEEDGESDEGVGARLRRRRDGKGKRELKKNLSGSEPVKIHVDALWARLNSAPSTKSEAPPRPSSASQANAEHTKQTESANAGVNETTSDFRSSEETITIKRTYNFAGTTTTEEKLVPKDSAEARLYLASQASASKPDPDTLDLSMPRLRRPLKRPSRFDTPMANPGDLLKTTTALKTPAGAQIKSLAQLKLERGQKLNTVEKSKLDWAGYVDKEKLKDELDRAEKARGGYMDRMEFLGRSESARDEAFREGKRK